MTFLSELATYKKDQEGELSYCCPKAPYEKGCLTALFCHWSDLLFTPAHEKLVQYK